MRVDVGFDMMERTLPYLAELLDDADFKTAVEGMRKGFATRPVGSLMVSMLPYFIREHRDAVIGLIAALKGCTIDEAKDMELHEAVDVLQDLFVEDMCRFFLCCLRMTRCM